MPAHPTEGFALLMMLVGVVLAVCVVLSYLYPPLRHLDDLPDLTSDDEATSGESAAADPAESRV
ncbi:MAG TPA: hypothetical protein VGJ07_13145 [Rugosimonospora sp.]